jgi:WAS/WASL-interacting protein
MGRGLSSVCLRPRARVCAASAVRAFTAHAMVTKRASCRPPHVGGPPAPPLPPRPAALQRSPTRCRVAHAKPPRGDARRAQEREEVRRPPAAAPVEAHGGRGAVRQAQRAARRHAARRRGRLWVRARARARPEAPAVAAVRRAQLRRRRRPHRRAAAGRRAATHAPPPPCCVRQPPRRAALGAPAACSFETEALLLLRTERARCAPPSAPLLRPRRALRCPGRSGSRPGSPPPRSSLPA